MQKRILTGNEAVAFGALRSGVKVVTGYPGTPSTGCITRLLKMELPGRHVEWSANEKVAFEIAAGAAWAGQRAMCTMKMSGVNVAYDALISIAYSGTNGGLVIYVADDPGVSAGMAEQDTRGFALMSDLPVLEPTCPADAYRLVQEAFELSEATGAPVFLRSTTAIALSQATIELADDVVPLPHRPAVLKKNIAKYTKAGAQICLDQHVALIERLEKAKRWIASRGLNELRLASNPGGVGLVAVAGVGAYLDEAFEDFTADPQAMSTLRLVTSVPFPEDEGQRLLEHCEAVLVLEELEPYVERELIILARQIGWNGRIVGKLDGTLPRTGEVTATDVAKGLAAVGALASKQDEPIRTEAKRVAAPRPITVCAGCPHRGTYLAIEAAIERAGLSKDAVMVTGDIGCTILGMNPPFELLWTEVSMGSSVSLAQGYVHAGIATPVIATIGDSTFFHGGIPGLLNAIQHHTPLILVIMDNGWTSMTGMQVNPGTNAEFQPAGGRRIDLVKVVEGLGPDSLTVVDPYNVEAAAETVAASLSDPGVHVVIARRECAIQARRRGVVAGETAVDPEACVLCKKCLRVTGCPALSVGEESIVVDPTLCNGCGICSSICPTSALTTKEVEVAR